MNTEERINALADRLDAFLKNDFSQQAADHDMNLTAKAERCADYRQILNLMGRYASYHYYAQHRNTYNFFSHTDPRTTAELGDTGVYAELDKIYQMFVVYHDFNNLTHTAHCHPLTTPYIQVAGDRETAKCFMLTNGFECLPGPVGKPQFCMWFYDGYDMTFVREEDGWKWLKFHLADDIKGPFYLSWGEAGKHEGPHPAGLVPPAYKNDISFTPYSIHRKPSLSAVLPEKYETYSE